MNILFVSSTRAGGSGLSQRQLAARLITRGHRVAILVDPGEGHRLTRYLYKRQVNLSTRLRASPLRPLLLAVQRPLGRRAVPAPEYDVPVLFSPVPEHAYRALRRSFAPDVVVASSIDRVSWRRLRAQARADGIPSVLYLREDVAHGHLAITNAPPDLLIANATSLAERARAAGFPCLVIPSAIETAASRVSSTRERVLLVNPLPSHGIDRLWAVARARPDIPFAVQESWALSDGARSELLAETASLPNVEFRPRTDDLGAVYRDARLLLAPHRLDNRPRVVVEAQANGIPVVASAYPGLVEAVGPGGVLIDPDEPDETWIDAVGRVWDDADGYARLVEAAVEHAARPEIDPHVVTSQFEDALEQLLAPGRRSQPATYTPAMTAAGRRALVASFMANPPQVHPAAAGGVWGATRDLYEFMADHVTQGAGTIETGCGTSTALLAAWGCDHLCIVPDPNQESVVRSYLAEHGHPDDRLTFDLRTSDVALPAHMGDGPLDFALVDGCHGFPAAILDWYYIGSRLRSGGVVVLDDTQLPQVTLGLETYLAGSPRWRRIGGTGKWQAWEKLDDEPLTEEWIAQPFLGRPARSLRARLMAAIPPSLRPKLATLKAGRGEPS